MPPPAGRWGMPPEVLNTQPTYGPDVAKNRADARQIMQKLGSAPDKARRHGDPTYRDPANSSSVILRYCAMKPPSITSSVPVTKDASSEARNSTP
jgi:hypothetical protein